MLAHRVGRYGEHNVVRLVAAYAIFDDVCNLVGRGGTGLLEAVGIDLERRGVKAQRHLAVDCGNYDIVQSVVLDLGRRRKERLGCGTIDTVFVYAGSQGHRSVVSAAVRVKEGQNSVGNRAHTQVVAGI